MKVKEIMDLIGFLSSSGLEEVNIETDGFKIKIKKSNEAQVVERMVAVATAPQAAPATAVSAPTPSAAVPDTLGAGNTPSGNYVEIKSPMIGTFYRSANPESPMFVNVGDKVSVGSTLCIVEAMKLFNEIESEISGTILKVLVDDSQPVEFDQPLFLIDPS